MAFIVVSHVKNITKAGINRAGSFDLFLAFIPLFWKKKIKFKNQDILYLTGHLKLGINLCYRIKEKLLAFVLQTSPLFHNSLVALEVLAGLSCQEELIITDSNYFS